VLTVPENVRIYLAVGATDMRKSFDTLAALGKRPTSRVFPPLTPRRIVPAQS